MTNRRKYQRYIVSKKGDAPHFEVRVKGELVHLVNFSLAGLCVLSRIPFSPGKIDVSIRFRDRGNLDIMGNVVRVEEKTDMWLIAIDLMQIYKLDKLQKI